MLHIGRNNPRIEYELTDKDDKIIALDHVECEKDLGIYVQDNLKFDSHIGLTINWANRPVDLFIFLFG